MILKKKKIVKIRKKGILFWITGLSGSGKTSIAKKIYKSVLVKYGPTIIISGDEIRRIYNLSKYSKKDRINYALSYSKMCKHILNKKINVILSTVSLFSEVRKWNRKNIENYLEIYMKTSINQVIKQKKKYFYRKKFSNVIGKDIKPDFPTHSNIIIENNFKRSISSLSKELLKKIGEST